MSSRRVKASVSKRHTAFQTADTSRSHGLDTSAHHVAAEPAAFLPVSAALLRSPGASDAPTDWCQITQSDVTLAMDQWTSAHDIAPDVPPFNFEIDYSLGSGIGDMFSFPTDDASALWQQAPVSFEYVSRLLFVLPDRLTAGLRRLNDWDQFFQGLAAMPLPGSPSNGTPLDEACVEPKGGCTQ
jgi:hypothetical protein